RAADAVEMLELRLEFLHDVATAMSEAPSLVRISAELDRNLAALSEAYDAMLMAFIPLCRRFAGQRVQEEEDQDDVFQVAFFGLRRAVSRFKPELGTNFVAYASTWMRQSVMRWRADESRIIRLPVQRQALLAETLLASEVLERRVLRAVTAQEIATELGKGSDLAAWLASLPLEAVGLDELHDVAAPGSEDGIPDDVRQADICALVHEELGQLPEKQADVIRRRFGIRFEAEMTLEEIGQIYGVTRERIRQIEAKGFRLLMNPARMRYLSKAL
ncbi:sigma-70 family RNA polymerase sigma factor, partial [Cypionkella sp.]|uniref:sigma-70 family RNA polymerase sigma factor n=1 Tax=Cypionkella sp. TaxID=2811411 RepID=UPI002AB894F9